NQQTKIPALARWDNLLKIENYRSETTLEYVK
ncbi:MAG: hypothetical protein G01um101477_150, partial [Candidatus Doudnabacteria bacterium Gr01-1014_77]